MSDSDDSTTRATTIVESVHAVRSGSRDRVVFRVVALLAVLPILVDAVRRGASGWIPTNDAAATVYRARHALGAHGSLVGLYAWPSSQAIGESTFSPGPWQLWWMSVPVKVLGSTWGPLLSMAVLNTALVLLAGWCVRRRFGERSAIGVFVVFGILIWSVGASVYSSPVPVVAVVPPFAAFCFVAWVLADGDDRALPIVAGLASYLVTCNPETAMLVPVIGAGAAGIWALRLYALRRRDPMAWSVRRRQTGWMVTAAIGVTLVAWVPALVQQFTNHPGNLTHLYRAAHEMPAWLGITKSIGAAFALFVHPPFWLRGSAGHSFLTLSGPFASPLAYGVAISLWAVAYGAAWVLAHRRGDRPVQSALLVAAVAMLGALFHALRTPQGQYFLPFWPVAAFVTFAMLYSFARSLRPSVLDKLPVAALGLTAVVALAAVPVSAIPHFTAGTKDQQRISSSLNRQIIPALRGRGPVTMAPAFTGTFPYAASLVVALDDRGTPVCAFAIVSFQGNDNPACARSKSGITVIYRSAERFFAAPPGEVVVARYDSLTPSQHRQWSVLSEKVRGGVGELTATGRQLQLTDSFRRSAEARGLRPEDAGDIANVQRDPALIFSDFDAQASFAQEVKDVSDQSGGKVVYTRLPGVSDAELLRWAGLYEQLRQGVVVTVTSGSNQVK